MTHFDYDVDSKYLRSVSQSNELLYCFLPSGKQVVTEKESSTRKWSTDTCVLGWTVKSIWAKGSGGGLLLPFSAQSVCECEVSGPGSRSESECACVSSC